MKRGCFLLFFLGASFVLKGQEPSWLDAGLRKEKFPEHTYFTGFAYVEAPQAHSLQDVIQQAKNEAQAELSKEIRVRITSVTQNAMEAQHVNGQYKESERFFNTSSVATDTEVVGVKVDSYYDAKAKLAYAFAYVGKQELLTYYQLNIDMQLQQAESLLNTAVRLEQNGEKGKARAECEQLPAIFTRIRYAQDLLAAIDADGKGSLQQERMETLRGQAVQMLARLSQGVYVYIEGGEVLWGKPGSTIIHKMKAQLAVRNCSFVDDVAQADFRLRVDASTRISSEQDGIVFCYADVVVELYDIYKQRVVFNDELSQKGSSVTREKAGRKALDNAVPELIERLRIYIK